MDYEPTLIERLAAWAERKLGIKPAVTNAFMTTVVLVVANWLLAGDPLDVNALKVAAYMAIIAVVGIVSPPATGIPLKQISRYRGRPPR